jgi:hypothetical protein
VRRAHVSVVMKRRIFDEECSGGVGFWDHDRPIDGVCAGFDMRCNGGCAMGVEWDGGIVVVGEWCGSTITIHLRAEAVFNLIPEQRR